MGRKTKTIHSKHAGGDRLLEVHGNDDGTSELIIWWESHSISITLDHPQTQELIEVLDPGAEDELLMRAIRHFGPLNQMLKLAEECSELSAAIIHAHLWQGKCGLRNVYEELADVEIMITQARMLLDDKGNEAVDRQIREKIERLRDRLNKEEEK